MPEATVVTSDNLDAFNAKALKLDVPRDTSQDKQDKKETVKPEESKETKPEAKEAEVKADNTKEAEDENEETQTEEEKKPGKLEKRFSKLTQEKKEAIARAEAAEERRRAVEAELEALRNPKAVEESPVFDKPKPEPSQFKDAFEYAEALANWTIDKRDAEKAAEEAKTAAQKARDAAQKTWVKRQQDFAKEAPDYHEVLASSDDVQLHQVVLDAITESDIGPQVLYHIANNPEIAESWHDLTPAKALVALGKLEKQLEKGKEPAKPEPEKREVSKAPAPINPVQGKVTPDNLVTSRWRI